MKYVYGTYEHQDNEVNLAVSKTVNRDRRGNAWSRKIRHSIDGTLLATGATVAARQADLNAKILALENAYRVEGQTATLYLDDGTTSSEHTLPSTTSIDGPRVVLPPDFPRDEQSGEYATLRNYSIVLEAEYLIGGGDLLVEWAESIVIIGNGSGDFVVRTPLVGPTVRQDISTHSPVRAVQSGQASQFYAFYPTPLPAFPGSLKGIQRTVNSTWTYRDNKQLAVKQWSYSFLSTGPLAALPSLR